MNSLGGNHIGNEGAKALASALQHPNCKVATLALVSFFEHHSREIELMWFNRIGYNEIGDEGVQSLANALQSPTSTVTSIEWVA